MDKDKIAVAAATVEAKYDKFIKLYEFTPLELLLLPISKLYVEYLQSLPKNNSSIHNSRIVDHNQFKSIPKDKGSQNVPE